MRLLPRYADMAEDKLHLLITRRVCLGLHPDFSQHLPVDSADHPKSLAELQVVLDFDTMDWLDSLTNVPPEDDINDRDSIILQEDAEDNQGPDISSNVQVPPAVVPVSPSIIKPTVSRYVFKRVPICHKCYQPNHNRRECPNKKVKRIQNNHPRY